MKDEKKKSALEECIVERHPPKATMLTGKDAHPRNYTTTLYDENGKLIDDGDLEEIERSYWEEFVEPDIARELERRLTLLETDDYFPRPHLFEPMEAPDGTEDES
jgi:hypothetical protein